MKKLAFILSLLITPFSQATELYNSTLSLCEKSKTCALQQMAGDTTVSPEMKAMIETSMAGMCQAIQGKFAMASHYKDLENAASKCIDSMVKLSCQQLENLESDTPTAQCESYQQLLKQYE